MTSYLPDIRPGAMRDVQQRADAEFNAGFQVKFPAKSDAEFDNRPNIKKGSFLPKMLCQIRFLNEAIPHGPKNCT